MPTSIGVSDAQKEEIKGALCEASESGRCRKAAPPQAQATEWLTGLEFFRKWQQGAKLTRTFGSKSNSIQWNHHACTSAAAALRCAGTGGGTPAARGRGSPGAGRAVQVAERPQGVRSGPHRLHGAKVLPLQTRGS